ncbi:MAG TPA: winged helix-turn-helix domain-containing protein [Thermoanaerobaculales bacterium]|nr:winged helix-turn-helix domain-containing protein [Thermoanaerobaculales bacterium]HQL29758.1 winged helix-turn-helix domain-containing protein [Thermoanaerobaculales bacterium]
MGTEAANRVDESAAAPRPRPAAFRIGDWRIDPELNRVSRNGQAGQLEPKIMDVLVRLASEPGEVVSKQQLLDSVWNTDFVTEGVLSRAIAELRSQLGDDARNPTYIATIPRRGYRLIAETAPLPDGPIEAAPAPTPEVAFHRRPRTRATAITAVVAIAALAVGIAALGGGRLAKRVTNLASPAAPPRLIVLPFDNYGPQERTAFALGITDEITSQLAMVPRLRVISRTTAVTYGRRAETVQQVAADLDVDYILEGSVRWETRPDGSELVRITPQLIRAADDAHVWSASFDRSPSELLAVQSEIGRIIVDQLDLTLPETADAATATGLDAAAYQAFLDGRAHLYSDEAEDYRTAIASLERAVELDPGFVRAWALLSEANGLMVHFAFDASPERIDRARQALEHALELGPDRPECHRARGFYLYRCQRDFTGALAALEQARQSLPNDSDVLAGIAYIKRRLGDWEGSLATHRLALELDPWNPSLTWNLASSLIYLRSYAEAEEVLGRVIAIAPGMRTPHFLQVTTRVLRDGSTERARHALDEVPGPRDERWTMAAWGLEVFDGNYRRALDLVESSQAARWNGVPTALLACVSHRALQLDRAAGQSCGEAVRLLRRDLEEQPRSPSVLAMLADATALAGDPAAAAGHAQLAREVGAGDAVLAVDLAVDLAHAEMLGGRLDAALDQLEAALQAPALISAAVLRNSAEWAPLRDHPRFQRILDTTPGTARQPV